MNFLEKDLETIIWENYASCEDRGLHINNQLFQHGRRFRQMNLLPAGIADLVNIHYDPYARELSIQVIECKRGKVNADTYVQAKRYAAALRDIVVFDDLLDVAKTTVTLVLIGAAIDTDSPFAGTIAQDGACRSFIYKYGLNGIEFLDCSIHWWATSSPLGSGNEVPDRYNIGQYVRACQYELYKSKQAKGDYMSPLLITPNGVLLNTWLSDLDFYGSAH